VGLAGAGRAEEDHVVSLVQEVLLGQVRHGLAFHRALEGEIEVVQRLDLGKRAALTRCSPP
jgi:hypothetical protein